MNTCSNVNVPGGRAGRYEGTALGFGLDLTFCMTVMVSVPLLMNCNAKIVLCQLSVEDASTVRGLGTMSQVLRFVGP